MSALMVLFLVVMSTRLLSITSAIDVQRVKEQKHKSDIASLLKQFEDAASEFPGIRIDKARLVIEFGDRARFKVDEWSLTDTQEQALRAFVPKILDIANGELGQKVLKRMVVEGFTDKTGTYLGNLSLSLKRSERVLCAMFRTPAASERELTEEEKRQIRDLFMVGGYSFNAARETAEESRRVEMRLEFLGVDERRSPAGDLESQLGVCEL
jgi:flagellar motor protein MotB